MRTDLIASKMQEVSSDFLKNLRKHWMQVILVWLTIGVIYIYLGGSLVNLPKRYILFYHYFITREIL